jgi:hypothetical protein
MKTNGLFASVISLFVVFLLFAIGLLLISLQWIRSLTLNLCEILMYRPHVLFVFGLTFIFLALVFLAIFYSLHHHRYLTLKVKPFFCDVDSKIISKYVKKCFERVLREKDIDVEVFPKREKLEIIAYIPPKNKFEEEELIEKAKEALKEVLKKNFGYNKEFLLTLKFR